MRHVPIPCLLFANRMQTVHMTNRKARQYSQEPAKRNSNDIVLSELLLTDNLVALAKYICDADPQTQAPKEILHVLSDVISGRSSAAEWYSSVEANGGQKDWFLGKSNKKQHRHFIDVLRQVRTLLKNFVRSFSAKRSSEKDEDHTSIQEKNLFEYLELEESDKSTMTGATTTSSSKWKPDCKSNDIKQSDTEEDLSFRIYC